MIDGKGIIVHFSCRYFLEIKPLDLSVAVRGRLNGLDCRAVFSNMRARRELTVVDGVDA